MVLSFNRLTRFVRSFSPGQHSLLFHEGEARGIGQNVWGGSIELVALALSVCRCNETDGWRSWLSEPVWGGVFPPCWCPGVCALMDVWRIPTRLGAGDRGVCVPHIYLVLVTAVVIVEPAFFNSFVPLQHSNQKPCILFMPTITSGFSDFQHFFCKSSKLFLYFWLFFVLLSRGFITGNAS